MSKKEMMAKIRRNQARERAKHSTNWVGIQLKELSDYIETGMDDALREKCLHAIRWLISYARRVDRSWREPWYVYGM